MPDYSEILRFLASNPPQLETERNMHASLLELLAHCLRDDGSIEEPGESLRQQIARSHFDHLHFS